MRRGEPGRSPIFYTGILRKGRLTLLALTLIFFPLIIKLGGEGWAGGAGRKYRRKRKENNEGDNGPGRLRADRRGLGAVCYISPGEEYAGISGSVNNGAYIWVDFIEITYPGEGTP